MMHMHTPVAPIAAPPAFWTLFLIGYLDASPVLAQQLWRVFVPRCSPVLLWQLSLCEVLPSDVETYKQRVRALIPLITPRDLLAAVERLCLPGQRRRPDLVALGLKILEKLDADGHWIP